VSTGSDESDPETLSPDEAFAVLGNDTRMEILQALVAADGPLSFSEPRDAVGMRDSGQFNYHLAEVEGHFVRKTDDGYRLRQAGRRVVEAVLSGAVTDDPVVEPTRIDEPCPLCGAPTVMAFFRGRVGHYCTECEGHYGYAPATGESGTSGDASDGATEYGYLGSFQLPPAGLQGRTPDEVFRTAATWGVLQLMAVASGVCPRCSASLAESVSVCEAHDSADEHCDQCGNRHAIQVEFGCTNCLYEGTAACAVALVADVDVLTFLAEHGINPVSPSAPAAYHDALMDYDEELRSVEPFEARLTLTLAADALVVTVDDDLNVVEATRR
jgi:ribosomal protein S27AE